MRVIKRMPTALFLSACVLVYGYAALDTKAGRVFSVNVDLSRPESIVWPLEIAVVGAMGEEGLRLGPNVGAGWRGKAGGEASYRFYVPEDGKYHLWAYALWFDKCTNAIFAKVDDHARAIVGNDPVFQKWHWVRAFSIWLTKGPHTLRLSNHSDNISVQNVFFINSGTVLPDDCGIIFSDVFYDGFDGCHIGNFTSWDIVCGQWAVKRPPARQGYIENALVGHSTDSAMILYRADDWANYSLHVAVKTTAARDPRAAAGILFGLRAPDDFYLLKWRSVEGSEQVEVRLSRQMEGRTELLETVQAVCPPNVWQEIQILLQAGTIEVSLNNAGLLKQPTDAEVAGGIGLLIEGQATAYFDDVHVRTVTETTGRRSSSLWERLQ